VIVRIRACWSSRRTGHASASLSASRPGAACEQARQPPSGQLERHTGLLGDPHELVGRYHAATRVLPADEPPPCPPPGRSPAPPPAGIHEELHPVERAAEGRSSRPEPLRRMRAHLLAKDWQRAPPPPWRGAQPRRRSASRPPAVRPAAAERQAGAGGHEHLAAVGLHGRCKRPRTRGSATAVASSSAVTDSRRSMNSSPPVRPRCPPAGNAGVQAVAISRSTLSPADGRVPSSRA